MFLKELPSLFERESPQAYGIKSLGATLIAEFLPMLGGPGYRFQCELELMGFSHERRDSLRESGILEQPGANCRECHIGLHFLVSYSVTDM